MMQDWFLDAKLGIFIHWGIYAVNGTSESWSFFNKETTYPEYMSQLDGFTASKWDPDAWSDLFVRSGAKYAVLTTKHHDGVALWDTKQNDLSVVKKTPAARDLITPYAESLRKHGLKVGYYFSHLDWSHPDYASLTSGNPEDKGNPFAYSQDGDHPERWENFLKFHRGQLEELCTQFGPIDLMWFDGDWERTAEQWRMAELREQLHQWQPNMILNSRMRGHGDYATPEQGQPIIPPPGPWEFCMTINDNWGYRPVDTNFKSPRQVIRIFAEVLSGGGNLLLDIAPMEDGTVPDEQANVLEELGAWIKRNEAAVYGTRPGLPATHFFGPTTQSADGTKLYLMFYGKADEFIAVKGVRNKILGVKHLASGQPLEFKRQGGAGWLETPSVAYIGVPGELCDPYVTVIEVALDGRLDVFTKEG
ncbi:MAG: alpha-L-fucosidase [Fimbriimonadaceae bacterium]|nr:alpha-L-fucosidase [Fimbriimonadaceae bacterium]